MVPVYTQPDLLPHTGLQSPPLPWSSSKILPCKTTGSNLILFLSSLIHLLQQVYRCWREQQILTAAAATVLLPGCSTLLLQSPISSSCFKKQPLCSFDFKSLSCLLRFRYEFKTFRNVFSVLFFRECLSYRIDQYGHAEFSTIHNFKSLEKEDQNQRTKE